MKFKPADNYDGLLKQALALNTLCDSLEKQKDVLQERNSKLEYYLSAIGRNAVEAERETNI